MKKIIPGFLAFSVVTAITYYSIAPAVDAKSAKPQIEQTQLDRTIQKLVFTVRAGDTKGTVSLGATVLPKKMVKLSAQMPGEIKFIKGSEGDFFVAGTELAGIDTTALLAKRRSAELGLASAHAGLRNAQMQYHREIVSPNAQSNTMMGGMPSMMEVFTDPMRNVAGKGDPNVERRSNLHQYAIGVETAQNQVKQAEEGLRELDEAIRNAVSVAPFDGVILNKMVEVGDIIQPGMPIITFADIRELQLQVEVPNRMLNNLKEGMRIKARLDGSDETIDVTVERIYPMAEQGGHTTTVKFDLPNNVNARSGMYAEAILPDPDNTEISQITIPESSIIWRGSLPAVFKVNDQGKLVMQLVRIGSKFDTGRIQIISGLRAGDRILQQPTSTTRSGQNIVDLSPSDSRT